MSRHMDEEHRLLSKIVPRHSRRKPMASRGRRLGLRFYSLLGHCSPCQPGRRRRRWWQNWGGPCGANVFEGFFGFKDEPVKSVKMKIETRSGILWRLPHEFALCSLQFRFDMPWAVVPAVPDSSNRLHLRACALKPFSPHLFNPSFGLTNLDAEDC